MILVFLGVFGVLRGFLGICVFLVSVEFGAIRIFLIIINVHLLFLLILRRKHAYNKNNNNNY